MPFLRFSRDKYGYEHTYLVHAPQRRGKPQRARVLYWYRTPPGVRVGRLPFDAEARTLIEAQNPGVVFDWDTIVSTPVPPAEPEPWRERRRAERAARAARRSEGAEDQSTVEADLHQEPRQPVPTPDQTRLASPVDAESVDRAEPVVPSAAPTAAPGSRRKRRRGGRRGRGRAEVQERTGQTPPAERLAAGAPDADASFQEGAGEGVGTSDLGDSASEHRADEETE